jgi:hypothetical protein
MIGDRFVHLLEELGTTLKVKLQPDKNNACFLKFNNGIEVQIETTHQGQQIIIATDLGQISQGRFRENVFREALKSNGLPPPRNGIFAYSKKNESLVLYDWLFIENITGHTLAEYLQRFTQKALLWKGTIARGEVPSFTESELSFGVGAKKSGLFGLVQS